MGNLCATESGDTPKAEDNGLHHRMDHNIRMRTHFKNDIYNKYEFSRGKPLGHGSFGTVWKAQDKETGEYFAVKTIPKKKMSAVEVKDLYREVDIMRIIGSSLNCVYMYDAYEDSDCFYLVLEWCKGGELYGRIKKGHYSEVQAAMLVRNVLQVCAQCHAKRIVYRDLKPENFLFMDTSIDSPLKATDFGLAAYHPEGGGPLRDASGTPVYMAPEVIRRKYGFECDLWSAGVVAYQLLTGRLPFPGPPQDAGFDRDRRVLETFKQILTNKPDFDSQPWPHISRSARDFVGRLLVKNPRKRMTVEDALEHPWIKQSLAMAEPDPEVAAPLLHGTVVQRLQRFSIYGHFKQLMLARVAQRLPIEAIPHHEELSALKEMFIKMHEHKDGGKEGASGETGGGDVTGEPPELTYEELRDGLTECGYSLSDEEVHQLCLRIDYEETGRIHYREFITALVDWTHNEKTKAWEHAAMEEFEKWDVDHDDHLDAHDLGVIMRTNSTDEEVFNALRDYDREGTNKISKEDFMELVRPHEEDELGLYDRRISRNSREHEPAVLAAAAVPEGS